MEMSVTKTVMVHLDLTLEEASIIEEALGTADQVSPSGDPRFETLRKELQPFLVAARR